MHGQLGISSIPNAKFTNGWVVRAQNKPRLAPTRVTPVSNKLFVYYLARDYTRLMPPNARLTVRANTRVWTPPVSPLRNNREVALPLLVLIVWAPIVGDGTVPVARVLAKLESSANPTAGGEY